MSVRLPSSSALTRATVIMLWVYYLLYVLVAPVIGTDAHFYDLARLYVIRQAGLLHNDVFTHFQQIAAPWTFDAIHWPLVRLGFAYALPSYTCFTGMLLITFLAVRDGYGAEVAWLSLLGLFALPTLVYQGTSNKSDIGIVFGAFCWFHAMRRFRSDGRPRHLVWSALAITFAGGAKTSGLWVAVLLCVACAWDLRRQRKLLAGWFACLAVFALLFLSVETYLANRALFGDYLGPGGLRVLRNNDGLAGATANLIRHVAYNIDVGADAIAGHTSLLSTAAEGVCQRILEATGLGTKGLAPAMGETPLDFLKSGNEAQAGFGPLGSVAMIVVPVVLLRGRWRSAPWLLAASSVVTFGLVCYTTGFNLWVNRFLMLPFALGTLATILYLAPLSHRVAAVRVATLVVLLYSALVVPAFSFSRKPADLWRSVADRDVMVTLENPVNLPVLRAVRGLASACPGSIWIVTSHPIAAQFPFYDLLRDREILARPRQITLAFLSGVQQAHPGRPLYVLALSQDIPSRLPELSEIRTFPGEPERSGGMTHVYRFGEGGCPSETRGQVDPEEKGTT